MSPPSALWRSGRALSGWDQGCAADMVRVCAAALSLSSPQPFETCCWQQVKEEGELPPAWIEPAEDLSQGVVELCDCRATEAEPGPVSPPVLPKAVPRASGKG